MLNVLMNIKPDYIQKFKTGKDATTAILLKITFKQRNRTVKDRLISVELSERPINKQK